MSTALAEPGLSIAQASAATGRSAHTLRYDERDGLLRDEVDRDRVRERLAREGEHLAAIELKIALWEGSVTG